MASFRGTKSIHHHRGTPPFSVCRPTPRSQSKRSYGVYHLPGKEGKRVYTIGPERRVYTVEPQTLRKKKGGFPRWWWCILFSSPAIYCNLHIQTPRLVEHFSVLVSAASWLGLCGLARQKKNVWKSYPLVTLNIPKQGSL